MASVCTQNVKEESYADYFDIMLIGKTGTGKSTTADKILLANPDREKNSSQHVQEGDLSEEEDDHYTEDAPKSCCEDLTMWHISENAKDQEMVRDRLKRLVECRHDKNPEEKLSIFRKLSPSNPHFELLANNTTKVRVLDVPGFFSADFEFHSTDVQPSDRESSKPHLQLMRNIIHVKELHQFKFNRIVYFLPTTGTLRRADQVLQTELRTLSIYFGLSIFRSMVVVATYSREIYDMAPTAASFNTTVKTTLQQSIPMFKEAVRRALGLKKDLLEVPPLVFLSYHETCDKVLELIKNAEVIKEGVELVLLSTMCTRCNLTIGEVLEDCGENEVLLPTSADEKIILCNDLSRGTKIAYGKSACHPMLIPKFTDAQRFMGGIVHLITLQRFSGKWPGFKSFEEICIACGASPGSEGCRRVRTAYRRKCKRCRECKHCTFCSDQCKTSTDCTDSCRKCHICATCKKCLQCGIITVDHTATVVENFIIEGMVKKYKESNFFC